jgi:hypothetical protein
MGTEVPYEHVLASSQHLQYACAYRGIGMVERFVSTSKVAFGPPHTFGWVRCSGPDAKGMETWERPDGTMLRLPRGARLARLRGSRGLPILVPQGR